MQNCQNGQNSLFEGQKRFPRCLNVKRAKMGRFGGTKSGLGILIRAPEVPFFLPPKRPIFAVLGVPKMALRVTESKFRDHF